MPSSGHQQGILGIDLERNSCFWNEGHFVFFRVVNLYVQ